MKNALERFTEWTDRHCPDWALGLGARLDGLIHVLRGHRVRWRSGIDLWTGCLGDISCPECPDTDHGEGPGGLAIWVRQNRIVAFVGRVLCGLLGHPALQHPKQLDRFAGERGRPTEDPEDVQADGSRMVYVVDQWHCRRCLYRVAMYETWRDANAKVEP